MVLAKGEQKKSVKIQPYGSEYVKVLEGLEGGEVLLQQSTPKMSGSNRNRGGMPGGRSSGNSGSNRSNSSGGGFPGGGPGGPM